MYQGRLTVITASSCLIYEESTDIWRVQEYPSHMGDRIKPVLIDGSLLAAIRKEDKCSLKRYNLEENTWTSERADMSKCCAARFLSIINR